MKKLISFLLLVGILMVTSNCEKSEITDIDVDMAILKEMEAQKIPSVVACVVKGDQIAWEGIYGFANVEHSVEATPQTVYTIMSISKLILSTSFMQLWEKGLADLDEDINRYLSFDVRNPNFPDQKITPRMLLTHTSGLAWPEEADRIPDFHHFYTHEDPPLLSEWLPEYILPDGEQYRSAVWKDFAPGTKRLYSNIATSLLGLIVEQISGMDFRDYCREHILDPLEMSQSGFRFDLLPMEQFATPYTDSNNPIYPYASRHYPAGFLHCSLEDFSHFMIAILNRGTYKGNRILQESSVDHMLELQNPESGHALLWAHCPGDCIGKKGGGTGYSTWTEWHFAHDRGMFLFSNKVNEAVYPGGQIYELVKYQCWKY